jgi:hypothetical protein
MNPGNCDPSDREIDALRQKSLPPLTGRGVNQNPDMKARSERKLKAWELQTVIDAEGLEEAIGLIRAEDIADPRLGQHWADAEILMALIRSIVKNGGC